MAGLGTILWQGFPEVVYAIVRALREAGEHSMRRMIVFYGIPDLKAAFGKLLATSSSTINGCRVL
jgi:hypothetical protein